MVINSGYKALVLDFGLSLHQEFLKTLQAADQEHGHLKKIQNNSIMYFLDLIKTGITCFQVQTQSDYAVH